MVNKCVDKSSGSLSAVKTLTLEREQVFYLKSNFMEIKELSHPNILSYKAIYFELEYQRCYLVMDYFPYPELENVAIE